MWNVRDAVTGKVYVKCESLSIAEDKAKEMKQRLQINLCIDRD